MKMSPPLKNRSSFCRSRNDAITYRTENSILLNNEKSICKRIFNYKLYLLSFWLIIFYILTWYLQHNRQNITSDSKDLVVVSSPYKVICYDYSYKDEVNKPDYALGSAGGKIITTFNTQDYYAESNINSWIKSLFEKVIYTSNKYPSVILNPDVAPGNCWAFKGKGIVAIQLLRSIYIDSITIEHISVNISPSNNINSAPKEISMTGIKDLYDIGFFFGTFTYDITKESVQHFQVKYQTLQSYDMVLINIDSNWGHDYTCLYRIRIHGSLV